MPDQPVALPPQGDKLEDVETDDEDRIAGCQPSLRQPGGHPRHLRMESAPAAEAQTSGRSCGFTQWAHERCLGHVAAVTDP
jgi:hypothetical protein